VYYQHNQGFVVDGLTGHDVAHVVRRFHGGVDEVCGKLYEYMTVSFLVATWGSWESRGWRSCHVYG
jgi:hypothetical protein